MVRRKDSFWEHVEKIEDDRFSCKFCHESFAGGISRIKSHLSGVTGRDIQICRKVTGDIQLKAKQALRKFDAKIDTPTKRVNNVAIDTPTKRAKNVAASNNALEGENISGKGQDRNTVNEKLAKFLVFHEIDIKSSFFIDFVKSVAEHGPGYELPTNLTLKSQVLPDIKKEVKEYVQNVIKCSVKTGCTLMYSGCPINMFAYTPIGVACIGSFSSTSNILCFEKDMASANVVQFIMNPKDYDSTMDIFRKKYPGIYLSRCATTGIRVLFKRIFSLSFVSNTIEVAKLIVLYIYKHKVNVPLRRVLRTYSSLETNVFELISLLEVESELQALSESIITLSSDQGKPCNYKQAKKNFGDAIFIDSVIHCKGFWSRGKMVAQLMQPLIQASSLVNDYQSYGPTSGYLYEMMERVQDVFEKFRDRNPDLYDDLCIILREARSDIISPIHEAAAFLNPIYMCSKKFKENDEMKNGVKHILEHLVAVGYKEDFAKQVERYRMKDSKVFTPQALEMLETCHPRKWWECCGNDIPVLQKCAIQILNQPCSFSVCKQQNVPHRRKRDEQTFLLNVMLMERCKSLQAQTIEPIIFDQLGLDRLVAACDDGDNLRYCALDIPCFSDISIDIIQFDSTGSWVDSLSEELKLSEESDRLSEESDRLFEESIGEWNESSEESEE